MNNRVLKAAMYVAMGMSLAAALPPTVAYAAAGDGSLVGRLVDASNKPLPDAEVTVRNPETGFTRTVKADADGYYRFPFLPVGKYQVDATKNGATIGKLAEVTVGLGNATTANVTVGAVTLEEIQVLGTRIVTAVDVRSTESATNMTREELERLPVDRTIEAIALLAPGLNKGDSSLGSAGLSFGGSSVAENTFYVNGLNITDFYKRIGSSTVPYAFYKEIQVKTGGYSVEFGRTTGGVVNAVTRSGTNEFEFGTEAYWEPAFAQSAGHDHFDRTGGTFIVSNYDEHDTTNVSVYASGPIVKDKLFFFAMYEARDYQKENTDDEAFFFDDGKADNGFWGAKVDWQINDKNLLELLAFSDKNEQKTNVYEFDYPSGSRGAYTNREFEDTGGLNWSATYTTYLTEGLSAKLLYGENERDASNDSLNDIDCNRIRDRRAGGGDRGCTITTTVSARTDTREAARLDFEWDLGDHLLRFGLDHENNTSDHFQHYPGPGNLLYEVNATTPGATLENGGVVPGGVTSYVRTRRNEVDGTFETINSAYYLEDNWSITPNLVLNGGLRMEAFDNKNSDGDSYIKIDDMLAPRVGFSWDMKGDSRTKLFGNAGRYFLPVANVINIKQAGGFLDERTFYAFNGFESFEYNGQTYQRPILGAQIGPVDNSQGDGSVGDLRGEVDHDMDPVYQDELILGFQSMIDDKWSYGVRGIYRKLHNAIDDMEITSNGTLCGGEPTGVGFVMGNPGEKTTVFTDTNCDGENDAYVTIDTSKAGWAIFDDDGNYVGERGWEKPKRSYTALELMLDRAWDGQWSVNASYTLSYSKGNAEGPVNSDTDFGDTGRTENFDNPWVNFGADGYLPNDRRHSLKVRGAYALGESWEVGGSLSVQSGRPISAIGVGNPFDGTNFYSYFICVENCDAEAPSERVYVFEGRGKEGRTPWLFDLGATVTYKHSFSAADLRVKLAVFNLLNQQKNGQVVDQLEDDIGHINSDFYRLGESYQTPRYATLTFNLDF
ncbi:MAG TPA: TonB-dependent receptor [Steroidobacteraceae bacterium]|nr:TonB-dependent receptor [Steroidobacteraceae bacterium]